VRTNRSVDDLLGKAKNRIALVGIELEGAWAKVPPDVGRLSHDGSVAGLSDPTGRVRYSLGEIPSHPLKVTEWEKWVRDHYPVACNHTCGLHIHMSFATALRYQRLMNPEYQKDLLRLLRAWGKDKGLPEDHPFWSRTSGKNKFCAGMHIPDMQARTFRKGGSRYAVINYCYHLHQTLEVRVLPMFPDIEPVYEEKAQPFPEPVSGVDNIYDSYTGVYRLTPAYKAKLKEIEKKNKARKVRTPGVPGVDLAVGAIQRVLDITNAFLLSDLRREQVEKATLTAEGLSLGPICEDQQVSI
jgi:hypothetical protein